MNILETPRLRVRELSPGDAAFILELLNEPAFIRNIADRGVRTEEDAVRYLLEGPMASYKRFGFGLFAVELKDSEVPIGMCGLLKRDVLDHPDIGFAFLQRHWRMGYAEESATAVLAYGLNTLKLERVLAITALDNHGSMHVLEKIGLRFDRIVSLPGYTTDSRLFVSGAGV